ncbi:AsmA family protein [Methyloferula stellata]|uniref:AsmA family protein n=1 Tax=Methyloferula stellata TaxID=876270 RepID=UPI00035CB85A|nr:AsmA family protein [Methyloferula stellata]
MKWALKIGTAGLAIAAAAVGAGFALEHLFVDALARRIEDKTGLQAHFTKTDLGFWPELHFTGDDLRLTDSDPSHDPVLAVDRVSFDLTWECLVSGKPRIAHATLIHPQFYIVEGETKKAAPTVPENKMSRLAEEAKLDGVTIQNGAITIENKARKAKVHAEAIDLRVQAADNGALDLSGNGRLSGHDVRFKAEAASLKDLAAGTPTTLKAEINADLGATPVTLQSEILLTDNALHFAAGPQQLSPNQVKATGALDWSKDVPALSLTLVANELSIGAVNLDAVPAGDLRDTLDRLNDQPLDLSPSRLLDIAIDARVKTLKAGSVKAGSLQAKANLSDGFLKLGLQSADFYQGTMRADLAVDGNRPVPQESLDMVLASVNTAPLLADAARFNHLEGRLDMAVSLKTTGSDSHAMASALTGTSRLHFHDGAITGINAPSTLRAVLAYLPPAWQSLSNRIDVTVLDGTFAIKDGMAVTNDLHAASPIIDARGKGNVGLADQTFDLRFEPKVVTQAGRDAAAAKQQAAVSPLDLGAAILVRGAWTDPQVSADLSGLLNDPHAIEKLSTLGQEFLGGGAGGSGGLGGGLGAGGQMPDAETMKSMGDLLGGLLGGGGMPDQPGRRGR